MSNLEDEIRDLREKNCDLAKEVQNLKILAAQKDREKLELTKENNELRLKLSRLRSSGAAQAHKLDVGLQAVCQETLSYLVQASGAVAKSMELAKQYIQERQELDASSPQWSHIGSSSNSTKKVNEVPPLLLGGQSIQPVVSLSRTMLNNRSINRSPNQNSEVTYRALPMHMLQDVYIPLTRIDAAEVLSNNVEANENAGEGNNSAEDLGLEESTEQPEEVDESQNQSTVSELDETRGLDAVMEESAELQEETQTPPRRNRPNVVPNENPLEGPSWLLDVAGAWENIPRPQATVNLEPDSTTPCNTPIQPPAAHNQDEAEKENEPLVTPSLVFSPTVRRRKRTSSPPRPSFSPRPLRKHSTGRVLKVVVAKMRLSNEEGGAGDSSPPKRAARAPPTHAQGSPIDGRPGSRRPTVEGRAGDTQSKDELPRFDAPSPNGATDAGVIVCESNQRSPQPRVRSRTASRSSDRSRDRSRSDSRLDYSDGEVDDTRTRRTRKQVSYKEKPLNRKLRR